MRAPLAVAATAVPLLLAVVAGVRVLTGALDADSVVGGAGYPWVTAAPNLLDRAGWMLSAVGFPTALTCSALGCLVLAAARWAPAPWRLDGTTARVAGFLALATAWVGVLLAAVVLLDAFGPTTELRQQLSQPAPPSDDATVVLTVVGLGTPWSDAASVAVPGGLAAAAAGALLRRSRSAG